MTPFGEVIASLTLPAVGGGVAFFSDGGIEGAWKEITALGLLGFLVWTIIRSLAVDSRNLVIETRANTVALVALTEKLGNLAEAVLVNHKELVAETREVLKAQETRTASALQTIMPRFDRLDLKLDALK